MPPNFLKIGRTLSPFNGADGFLITARSAMPASTDNLVVAAPWRPHLVGSKRLAFPSFPTISRRNFQDGSDNMINMMIILLGFVFFSLVFASLLFLFLRRRRQRNPANSDLPAYDDVKHGQNHRGLTIETTHNGRSSIFFISPDGEPMLANPKSPPHSPDNVPQIHITFPDEHDENGETKSGRVLVVRVGDNAAVGLEPMQEEQLPAYEKEVKGGQFQSIDMDQIGGLQEKDRTQFQ
ncbi:hypothetical protein E4U54_001870 [Claviceps lovelessii]|nr:hypothetical protein E4U54_001870 [Claviceps lovelessii]